MEKMFRRRDDPVAFQGTEGQKPGKFREGRDEIDSRIQAWLAEQK